MTGELDDFVPDDQRQAFEDDAAFGFTVAIAYMDERAIDVVTLLRNRRSALDIVVGMTASVLMLLDELAQATNSNVRDTAAGLQRAIAARVAERPTTD